MHQNRTKRRIKLQIKAANFKRSFFINLHRFTFKINDKNFLFYIPVYYHLQSKFLKFIVANLDDCEFNVLSRITNCFSLNKVKV